MKILPLAFLVTGCASTSVQSDIKNERNIIASEKYFSKISAAREAALETINGSSFEKEFLAFHSKYSDANKITLWQSYNKEDIESYNVAWNKPPFEIIRELRDLTPTLKISTYGGIKAWWTNHFSGNLAYDGGLGTEEPISLNEFGLSRKTASISGSIVHEAAHRIGLRHDNYGEKKTRDLGKCEPPYVIGQLVNRKIEGDAWEFDELNDCEFIREIH